MKKFFTRMLGVCSLLIAFSFTTTDLSAQCAAVPAACVDVSSSAYTTVTTNDPFCCNTSWDSICQNAYNALNGSCTGGPVTCTATTPACVQTGSSAYATVIASDPFCCNNTWDSLCQSAYNALNGSCLCAATPPTCVNILSAAYQEVVTTDAFCCQTEWDSVCQAAYDILLPGNVCTLDCPDLFANIGDACFTGGPFPGVVDASCNCVSTGVCVAPAACVDINSTAYATTIANDSFCCQTSWDSLCQSAYDFLSGTCDGTDPCTAVPDACVNLFSVAYATVIANDAFCCNTSWDSVCQDAYDLLSNSCTGACIAPPACVDITSTAYATVTASDPFCCDSSWDSICQNAYDALNGSCGGGGACLATPPTCVDTASSAYATVIANDPFCCDTSWDTVCQNAYDALNGSCIPVDCPALGLNIGDACNDGNANTENDVVDADCVCAGTPINPCNVDGGTVATVSPRLGLCKGDGQQDQVQLTVSGNVGVGLFGIVRQSDLEVVASNASGLFNIENLPAGNYFAGHVSVLNIAQLTGITNVNQLSGCFDLSNQLAVTSIQLAGGTVTTGGVTTVCGGTVTATVSGNQGPQSRFVLLNQTATVVIAQNQTGVFNFNPLANGIYRIVHISYSNVNLGTITPPVLPKCVVSSNLVTVTKVACPTALLESSPNPTAGTSYVSFSVPTEEYTTLEVYDMSGRKVTELFRQVTEADAQYRLEFDGLGLPNGVYIYRLTTGSEVIIEKFMIAK